MAPITGNPFSGTKRVTYIIKPDKYRELVPITFNLLEANIYGKMPEVFNMT